MKKKIFIKNYMYRILYHTVETYTYDISGNFKKCL